jgi:hypothetical protein
VTITKPSADDELVSRIALVSAVRRYLLVDAGDVTGLIGLFAPDARFHRPGYQPLTGRDELERFYREDRGSRRVRTRSRRSSRPTATSRCRASSAACYATDGRPASGSRTSSPSGRTASSCGDPTFFFAPLV